jgi:hypothetical protein
MKRGYEKILELINTIREIILERPDPSGYRQQNAITIFPQVGDERIEFGKPENAEVKFKKLMIFYKEILPRTGWNKYNRVNLEYEGQIVTE